MPYFILRRVFELANWELFSFQDSPSQSRVERVGFEGNIGIGVSEKPGTKTLDGKLGKNESVRKAIHLP